MHIHVELADRARPVLVTLGPGQAEARGSESQVTSQAGQGSSDTEGPCQWALVSRTLRGLAAGAPAGQFGP